MEYQKLLRRCVSCFQKCNQTNFRLLSTTRIFNQQKAEDVFSDWCEENVRAMKREGTYVAPSGSAFPNIKAPYIMFMNSHRKLLDFTSGDYLGFAADPHNKLAYSQGLSEAGSSGKYRQLEGVQPWTLELERLIATYHYKPACFTYGSSGEAMSGLFSYLKRTTDMLFSDEYNTHYVRGGINESQYDHLNMDDLEEKLYENRHMPNKVIYTEGVFPQTGETAPLPQICDLAYEYHAKVVLNDTHGVGVMGKLLRGTEEHTDQEDVCSIITCDFGYGLGNHTGGYMVGDSDVISDICNTTSDRFNSVDVSAAVASSVAWAFHSLSLMPKKADTLRTSSEKLRYSLRDLGFNVPGTDHPSVTIQVKNPTVAETVHRHLKDEGIFCAKITSPQVRKDSAYLRFILCTHHEQEHIDKLLNVITKVGKRTKLV